MYHSIYVAATGQHVGKTTSTLGLVAALKNQGLQNLGYCKPMGQELVKLKQMSVDKDAFLFSKIMGFELAAEIHSPATIGRGVTKAYLDNPENFRFKERILAAKRILEHRCDAIVYEGTGHPGVGSIVGLSNAQVAKLLGAKVVLVVEGGIGNTLDRLDLSLSYFQASDVPVIGVIVNKVLPEKMEQIEYYLSKRLNQIGLPLLGLVPFDKSLSNPIMQTIQEAVKGRFLVNSHGFKNRVEAIIPGSLIDAIRRRKDPCHLLLLVSYKRAGEVLRQIEALSERKRWKNVPLSGVILTGEDLLEKPLDTYDLHMDYVMKHEIPMISTAYDTLGAYTKIDKIEVKINTATPWKVERANELIKKHVQLDLVLDFLKA